MKRDWDIVRDILLAVEASPYGVEVDSNKIPNREPADVAYNMWLLIEEGLVEGGGRPQGSMGDPFAFVHRMRWPGHELLDQMREASFWNKVKQTAIEKGIGLTVDAIKSIAAYLIQHTLGQ